MATTTTKLASQSSDKPETILVTGATGTVGSEVIKQVSRATKDINIKAAVHMTSQDQRQFLMNMQPEFYLSKLLRKYFM